MKTFKIEINEEMADEITRTCLFETLEDCLADGGFDELIEPLKKVLKHFSVEKTPKTAKVWPLAQ
jgi:hypothetical protein